MITRESINKNIRFKDVKLFRGKTTSEAYSFHELSSEIDRFKNLLQDHYQCQPGQTVLIGEQPGMSQIALVFACCELGLPITVIDYHRRDNFKSYQYTDPKTKILLPISFFIVSQRESTDKFEFFQSVCEKTIILNDHRHNTNTNDNKQILSQDNSLFIRCTSSGTTGTPKIVEHTHEFMESLINRNTVFFDDTVGLVFNLNHGSSLATFFMPGLFSPKVNQFINFEIDHGSLGPLGEYDLSHLMLPYPHLIDNFLQRNKKQNDHLTIYTLSTIQHRWRNHIKTGKIRDVVSFFGSNETSGPIFVNHAGEKGFKENQFRSIDDFYKIDILANDELSVALPIYNKTINTNDTFKIVQDRYQHLGRNDIIRINGFQVDVNDYTDMIKSIANCDLVYDSLKNEIYLAIWEIKRDPMIVKNKIDKELKAASSNCHYISKCSNLDHGDFLSGVKLDQELLRDYFRKKT